MITEDPYTKLAVQGRSLGLHPIIDAHAHLGPAPDFPIIQWGAEHLLKSMDTLGIDVVAVSSIPGFLGDAENGNELAANAINRWPDRFWGYVTIDIGYPERIADQLENGLSKGFRGIKIWSYGMRPGFPYDHENYREVFLFAAHHRLPILAHVFGPELNQLEPAIEEFKGIRWILAHVGSADLAGYKRLAATFPNVFLETCLSKSQNGLVEHLVKEGFEDKVIWGSDAPFLNQPSQLGRIVFADLSADIKKKLLYRNAKKALGL